MAAGHPEEKLLELTESLIPYLRQFAPIPGTHISAQIVALHRPGETMSGFYFSDKLVQSLATLRASVDVDVVQDLA